MAQLLITAGAKMDAVNETKQTPLDVAKLNREVSGSRLRPERLVGAGISPAQGGGNGRGLGPKMPVLC